MVKNSFLNNSYLKRMLHRKFSDENFSSENGSMVVEATFICIIFVSIIFMVIEMILAVYDQSIITNQLISGYMENRYQMDEKKNFTKKDTEEYIKNKIANEIKGSLLITEIDEIEIIDGKEGIDIKVKIKSNKIFDVKKYLKTGQENYFENILVPIRLNGIY